jgi:hypothetical protein
MKITAQIIGQGLGLPVVMEFQSVPKAGDVIEINGRNFYIKQIGRSILGMDCAIEVEA